ncbi:MAG: CDP-alcohol phosphatidyltransferase family protein, partial [Panacagrimonas sp.]
MNLWIDTRGLSTALTLFGVPPLERLRRTIGKLPAGDRVTLSGDANARWTGAVLDEAGSEPLGARLRRALAAAGATVVAIDGANVIDPRLIRYLGGIGHQASVASRGEGPRRAVALALDPSVADAIPIDARDLRAVADALLDTGRAVPLDEQRFPAYIDKLRRSLPYWIHAVDSVQTRRVLERQMFWDNYKGSTDLLTRWVYPPLVWPLTLLCARLHIHPNVVTVLSIVLCFAAVPLWVDGQWLAGFVCAYVMSVLDSVDGKVARLTLTDSKIGNTLDHGLDQVHPPFWYFAWAWGLGARGWSDPLF